MIYLLFFCVMTANGEAPDDRPAMEVLREGLPAALKAHAQIMGNASGTYRLLLQQSPAGNTPRPIWRIQFWAKGGSVKQGGMVKVEKTKIGKNGKTDNSHVSVYSVSKNWVWSHFKHSSNQKTSVEIYKAREKVLPPGISLPLGEYHLFFLWAHITPGLSQLSEELDSGQLTITKAEWDVRDRERTIRFQCEGNDGKKTYKMSGVADPSRRFLLTEVIYDVLKPQRIHMEFRIKEIKQIDDHFIPARVEWRNFRGEIMESLVEDFKIGPVDDSVFEIDPKLKPKSFKTSSASSLNGGWIMASVGVGLCVSGWALRRRWRGSA